MKTQTMTSYIYCYTILYASFNITLIDMIMNVNLPLIYVYIIALLFHLLNYTLYILVNNTCDTHEKIIVLT